MSYSWIFGTVALLLWVAATLLYMRPTIRRWLAERRASREK